MVKLAVSNPSTLGVNLTLIVHEPPAARLAGSVPQVLVCEKSPALAPVNPMLEMFSATNSLFWRVKLFRLLAVFTATLLKLAAVGVSVTSATPFPLSEQVSVWY
jgi:hypothetical protein